MFGKREDPQPAPQPAPSPLCDMCGKLPAYAHTFTFGWVCQGCWNSHYVPMLQAKQATVDGIRRSLCCPACALIASEESSHIEKWLAAHLVYGWCLCDEHRTRISALVQDSETNADLVLSTLLSWYRFKEPRQAPKKGA